MLPVLPKSLNTHHNQLADITTNSQNSPRQSPTQSVNKRSPSMIFRIEHLLPNTSSASTSPPATIATSDRTMDPTDLSPPKKSKIIRAGVHVSQLTPRDTISEALDAQTLINGATTVETTARAYCSLIKETNTLSMTPSIMRKIKLSEDTHSNNALFEVSKGQVVLRVVRDIQRDDEIVAWFGEEVTLLMSIPFLTPLNIQGNNRYTCHLCHLTFETPNPLKIHLALGCGRHNIDILWIRLFYALKATHYTQHMLPLPLPVPGNATSSRLSPVLPTSSATSSSISPSHSPQPQPSISRFSAFKPICSSASIHHPHLATSMSTVMASNLGVPQHHTTSAPLSFLPSISSAALPHMSLLQPSSSNPLNAAAQIEAIVSNMGASKQGHLCIYCGKVYSRKYGLKIHIRTHTGFKPLKCKFCLRPFGDPSNLNKHVRLHLQNSANNSSSEGYQCNLCPKTLGRRRDLQKHMETRHGYASTSSDAAEKVETTNSN
ncbi:protein snail [Lucilia sericata]|uniref:protein snail n=1 Tax=Lucilia sericata TaxID=13632 RepID=UPI0018A845D6|nr:protein snail [Lucilia sericata]